MPTPGSWLSVTGSGALQTDYSYDAVGNRLTRSGGGAAETYSYDAVSSHLLSVLAGGVTRAFTWSASGNVTVDDIGGAATTHFLYDLAGRLIGEADGATSAATAEYVWLEGMPLAFLQAGAVYYVHTDHLGTPQRLTDGTKAVVWDASYAPFGAATVSGSLTFNLRFPGQYEDVETGLHYNDMRDYDPTVGRYVQADPAGIFVSAVGAGVQLNHLYSYTRGNPIRYVDPFGLWTCPTSPGAYRACDPCGCGEFGSPRENDRIHAGADVCAQVGTDVVAPIGGWLEEYGDGVRITGRVDGTLYVVIVLHFNAVAVDGRAAEGDLIGTMPDMTSQYNCDGMTNHVHVEVYKHVGGKDVKIDPATVLPCGQ